MMDNRPLIFAFIPHAHQPIPDGSAADVHAIGSRPGYFIAIEVGILAAWRF